jgi:hypothetical protein
MSRKRALTPRAGPRRGPGYRRPATDARAPYVRATETCPATTDTSTAEVSAAAKMAAAAHASPTTAEMRAAAAATMKSTAAASSTAAAASSGSRVGGAGQNGRQSDDGKDFEFWFEV